MSNNYPDNVQPKDFNEVELPPFIPTVCKKCKGELVLNEDLLCEDCFISEVRS